MNEYKHLDEAFQRERAKLTQVDGRPMGGIEMTSAERIAMVCDEIKDMLLQKNAAYGDSALNPVRIFSRADPIEQINVRIDDKLSRLTRGSSAGEDTELDLIGYLILKRVAQKRNETEKGSKNV